MDTSSPHYKGRYSNIYAVHKAFPNGGVLGDFVDIGGFAHYWNKDRGTWSVNENRDQYWDEKFADIENLIKEIGEPQIKDGSVGYVKLDAFLQSVVDECQSDHTKLETLLALLQGFGGNEIFKGAWSPDGDYNKYDTVFHLGCRWMCLQTGTHEEPSWYATTWMYLSGDNSFSLPISSSKGTAFRSSNIDTEITVRINFGSFDVTEMASAQYGFAVTWKRDTGDAEEDNAWTPEFLDPSLLKLKIRNYDVGNNFFQRRLVTFTVTVKIPTSEGYDLVEQIINIK